MPLFADAERRQTREANYSHSWLDWVFFAALAIILFYKLPYWFLHPLSTSPDQAVYLEMAQLILSGKTPYIDFFDFNPPLIMYLNVLPVLVARLIHWPVPLVFNTLIQTLHLLSISFCTWLVFKHRAQFCTWQMAPLLIVSALFTQMQISDVGQREHIFLIFYLPFLFWRFLLHFKEPVVKSPASFIGLTTGLVLSLKPHFFLFALAGELGLYLVSRRIIFSKDIKVLLCVPLVYLFLLLFLPAAAKSVFLEEALPLYTYGLGWNAKSFMHMLTGFPYFAEPFWQMLAALFFAPILLGLREDLRRFAPALILLVLMGIVHYIAGGQAWTYRLMPMALFSQMLLALESGACLLLLKEKLPTNFWAPIKLTLAGLLLAGCLAFSVFRLVSFYGEYEGSPRYSLAELGYSGDNPRFDFDSLFFSVMANSRAGEAILTIGSGIRPGFPAQLQSQRGAGSRYLYSCLAMFPSAMEARPELFDKFRSLEEKMVNTLGQDILQNKPRLVFVQVFPIEEMLEKYQFKRRFLADYSEGGYVEGCKVLKRKD